MSLRVFKGDGGGGSGGSFLLFIFPLPPGRGADEPSWCTEHSMLAKHLSLNELMIHSLGYSTRPTKKSRMDSDQCTSSCEGCKCDSSSCCCSPIEEHHIDNSLSLFPDVVPAKLGQDDAHINETMTTIKLDLEKHPQTKTSTRSPTRHSGLFRQLSLLMKNTKKKLK